MFGYIVPNRGELKIREWEEYRCWYCGLCHRLQDEYGLRGRLSLNYDMTFLAMLLSSLYDTKRRQKCSGCVLHPLRRQKRYDCPEMAYAASMNVLLTYYKCLDDWKDDRNILRGGYGMLLQSAGRKVAGRYLGQAETIQRCLSQLDRAEQNQETDLDRVSGIFGRLCGTVFAKEKDIWHDDLWNMGFYLGKFIYLLDAWEDLAQDEKRGSYNPFLARGCSVGREDDIHALLVSMIAEACRYFERLPIVENAEIFRNILYSGVWTRYRRSDERTAGKNNAEENETGARRG